MGECDRFLQINLGSSLNWPFLYFEVENLLFVIWDPIYVIVYPICDFCLGFSQISKSLLYRILNYSLGSFLCTFFSLGI
jgi:hypothetical protein